MQRANGSQANLARRSASGPKQPTSRRPAKVRRPMQQTAQKRIKTLATEWGVSVDDVLASCARLHFAHAHSESSLLSPDETDRAKTELDQWAQRAAVVPRETVLETSAGTVVEKRLN